MLSNTFYIIFKDLLQINIDNKIANSNSSKKKYINHSLKSNWIKSKYSFEYLIDLRIFYRAFHKEPLPFSFPSPWFIKIGIIYNKFMQSINIKNLQNVLKFWKICYSSLKFRTLFISFVRLFLFEIFYTFQLEFL